MTEAGDQAPAAWWERAFGAGYLDVYAHRDDSLAADEVAALLPRLRTAPGPILDACCGHGRHLEQLRANGLIACGFDLSAHLLMVAANRPLCRGHLARADLRRSCFAEGFGAILLLFTAFGYFDDQSNAASLAELARLLSPGGWLVIDVPEPQRLRRTLCAQSSRMLKSGKMVIERRSCQGTRVMKEIEYQDQRWTESVRLYERDEIHAMARAAGLRSVETWPGLRGPTSDEGRLVHWLTTA